MNHVANILGWVADQFYMCGAWFNNLSVRIKMNHYADNHPSGGSRESN